MNYYIDTEFLEGKHREKFPINLFRKETPNTIDLISIGIVSEDGREYYEISKDFNLKEAWNRYQYSDQHRNGRWIKEYWIRENVLLPIYNELHKKEQEHCQKAYQLGIYSKSPEYKFTFKNFKKLINKYGKTNKQIKYDILQFTLDPNKEFYNWHLGTSEEYFEVISNDEQIKPKFYAYYGDYDWVVFCWLFGKMIELPKGYPMYCRDLKQIFDDQQQEWVDLIDSQRVKICKNLNLYSSEIDLKSLSNYPKQEYGHNALSDAKWNSKLHKFLTEIGEKR